MKLDFSSTDGFLTDRLKDLSKRELEALVYITNFFNTKSRMPTHNEIKIDLGLTSNGFRNRILEKLKDLGYLKSVAKNQIAYRLIIEEV